MSAALALPRAHAHAADDRGERPPTQAPGRAPLRRRADEVHFRIVYGLTLPVFLLASLLLRIVPGRRPSGGGPRLARPSVLGEAKAAAQTCGSLSLMG